MENLINQPKYYRSIGVVSRLTAVPPQTIREMEERQLLPPIARLDGTGYRLYDEQAIAAIRTIRAAREAARDVRQVGVRA
jgi:DNA-binding transcriptional MerR regulator